MAVSVNWGVLFVGVPVIRALLVAQSAGPMRSEAAGDNKNCTWLFLQIGGLFLGCPCNKIPTVVGSILGPPIFGNFHVCTRNDHLI